MFSQIGRGLGSHDEVIGVEVKLVRLLSVAKELEVLIVPFSENTCYRITIDIVASGLGVVSHQLDVITTFRQAANQLIDQSLETTMGTKIWFDHTDF